MDAVWRDIIITLCLSLRLPPSLSLSPPSLALSCLLQAPPPPLTDPFPNCPNYRTACTFIPKHADKSLTELRTDLLQNVQIQPIPDAHPLHSTHCRQLLTSTHWSLLVDYTLNTHARTHRKPWCRAWQVLWLLLFVLTTDQRVSAAAALMPTLVAVSAARSSTHMKRNFCEAVVT